MHRKLRRFMGILLTLSMVLTIIPTQTGAFRYSDATALESDEGFVTLSSATKTGVYGPFEYEVIDNTYVSITEYLVDDEQKELVTSVIFPDTIDGYPVQRITAGVFRGFSGLAHVELPNTLTYLGGAAFGKCTSLKTITLPASLNSAGFTLGGNGPFDGSALQNVTFAGEWTKIPEHLFDSCGELSAITLPDGITEIGQDAFENCDKLSSITIPDGVSAIREGAFQDCDKLSIVKLPNTLTHLAGNAFGDCKSLTTITLPASLDSAGFTFGGNGPFDGSALQNVTFAGEWTKIPEHLFDSCGELSAITLPDGIAEIGQDAFENCDQLICVVIPDSVHTIENNAFDGCAALRNVFFRGNAPSVIKASSSHRSFPADATLHYMPNKTGWADSGFFDADANTWNGYKLTKWNGIMQKVSDFVVPKGQYCIHVVDENGAPIPNALVTWKHALSSVSDYQPTDATGKAFFSATTAGEPEITVLKKDFLTWTNKNSNWQKNEDRYDIVILYPEGVGDYKLAQARYSTNGIHWTWDLLSHTKKRSLGPVADLFTNSAEAEFWIACSAYKTENVVRYELWQNDQLIAEDPHGIFRNISNECFSEGGGCFVRVISNEGDSVDTAINLEFVKIDINKDASINILNEKLSFKVSDDVPYLGGSTFEFSWPFTVPIRAAYSSEGKLMFGINMASIGESSDAEKIQEVKKLITKARNLGGYLSKQNYAKFLKLAKEKTPFQFFKGGQATLLGYVEADPGSTTASGYILLETKIDLVEFGYNTLVPVPVVVVLPVTAQIEMSLDADFSTNISYDWADQTFSGAFSIKPTATLKAFGGIGVSKVAGAGAYGSAALEAEVRVVGVPKGVRYVDLTGELGVKAYFGSFSGEVPFAYDTWHIYTANTMQPYELYSPLPTLSLLYDASSYHPADLSYLEQESIWFGNSLLCSAEALSTEANEKTTLAPLLTGTYRNAQPVLAATENAAYAAFLRADSKSGHIYVSTTKFDGITWCDPVRADSESFLEDAPSLCAHNDKIYLAYAQTSNNYTGESLLSYAQNQRIVVGSIDPATLAFTKEASFSADGFANMQQLSIVNGIPTLIWVNANISDNNSVLFPSGGTIYCSQFKNHTWSEAVALVTSADPILSVTLGESNGELAVAYITDSDGCANTHNDYTLYQATTSKLVVLASGSIGKVCYSLLPNAVSRQFVWNDDSCLNSADGGSIAIEGITSEYAVVGEKIYYCSADKDSSNLAVMQYKDGNWSLPMQLTSDSRYLENISVVSLNGSDYCLGMQTEATIKPDEVIDDKSLVWAKINKVNDIVLEDVWYEESALAAGETTNIEVLVANAGENTVNSVEVSVDGAVVHTEYCTLQPGEERILSIQITCPSDLTSYTISVSEPGTNDYTIEDNSFDISVALPDVSVQMVYSEIGSARSVLTYVTNEGVSSASGTLYFFGPDNALVGITNYSSLQHGESAIMKFDLSAKFIGDGNIDLTATAIPAKDDLYLHNNSASLHIGAVTHDTQICSIQWSQPTLNAQISCGTENVRAYFAAFNKQGQMIELCVQALAPGFNEINQAFADSSITEIRAFILNERGMPQCLEKCVKW